MFISDGLYVLEHYLLKRRFSSVGSGSALVPSKDAICHMIGDVVVFLCSLVLCLLTIFSASVLFSVVYVSHGVTDGIADWITLA